jgi:hypothetical protein
MAANNSIAWPTTLENVGGASSTRNNASTTEAGTAISIAINVETIVPKMELAAPKFCATGFHVWEKRKPNPNFSMDKEEERKSSMNIPAMTMIIKAAQNAVRSLNAASPALKIFFVLIVSFTSKDFQS